MLKSKFTTSTLVLIVIMTLFLVPQNAKAEADGNSVQIGIEYVGKYSGTGSPVIWNLDTASSASRGDIRIIKENPNWGLLYIWGDSNVWEKDFRSSSLNGNDYRLTDDVDLLFYVGHGVKPGLYNANDYSLIMNNQNDSYYAKQGEMSLGNRDLEWFITFTCNFTNGFANQIGRLFNKLHALAGYKTDMTVTSNAGDRFSYWAATQKYPISVAYENYAWDTQNAVNKNSIRIFRATSTWNDHLWGFGSVASDPVPYSSSPTAYSTYEADIW